MTTQIKRNNRCCKPLCLSPSEPSEGYISDNHTVELLRPRPKRLPRLDIGHLRPVVSEKARRRTRRQLPGLHFDEIVGEGSEGGQYTIRKHYRLSVAEREPRQRSQLEKVRVRRPDTLVDEYD